MTEISMPHADERRVSVAMATYNGARFIAAQLTSIAAQSVLPRELVVSDDGSSDGTLSIVDAFAQAAPFPVHVMRNPRRLGYAGNFVQTAARCTAPLIAFCDQDDVWHTDKIARMQACFDQSGDILLVYHNAMLIDASGVPAQPFYDVPPSQAIAAALSLQPWHFSYGYSQVFRRELLGAVPFWAGLRDTYHPDQAMGHDVFFFALATTLGGVAYLHDCLADYRQHPGQTFGTLGCAPPGLLERWRYRLEDRRFTYAHLADVADAYAALFLRWRDSETLAPHVAAAAQRGAKAWALLGDLYQQRAQVVGAPSRRRRLQALRALQRLGAYGDGFWTFGEKARWKDAVLGVLLSPVVGRFGRSASAGDPTVHRGAGSLRKAGGDVPSPPDHPSQMSLAPFATGGLGGVAHSPQFLP